jgi:signal transduction histidine kinase
VDEKNLQDLEQKYRSIAEELGKAKEELSLQTWGLTKTNDAIKILYKELEKKNKELQKLDKLKTDFINTVSHELRTPLTTVRECISQILDGIHGSTNDAQREFLSICLGDVDRLKRMIDDLLDIAKLEAGKVKIARRQLDLAGLARGVIAAFYPKAKSMNVELREKFSAEKIMVFADKDSMIRVFTNLIGNALKFTNKGNIEISVTDKSEHVECCVADTGRGIAEDDLPKVFGKFQQFDRKEGGGEKGTGLGLSISKNIIDLHHGKIWVESKLGEGARFIFTLPKYTEDQILKEHVAEALQEAVKQNAPLSILVFANINSVAKDLESLIKQNLRHADVIFKNTHTMLAVLPDMGREDAREGAEKILAGMDMSKGISYGIVSFPEDGNTAELLYAKITQRPSAAQV